MFYSWRWSLNFLWTLNWEHTDRGRGCTNTNTCSVEDTTDTNNCPYCSRCLCVSGPDGVTVGRRPCLCFPVVWRLVQKVKGGKRRWHLERLVCVCPLFLCLQFEVNRPVIIQILALSLLGPCFLLNLLTSICLCLYFTFSLSYYLCLPVFPFSSSLLESLSPLSPLFLCTVSKSFVCHSYCSVVTSQSALSVFLTSVCL